MAPQWHRVASTSDLAVGDVAGVAAVCLIHTAEHGYTALDNRCPHQGGPLSAGQFSSRWLICPWHGYEHDPDTGEPLAGFSDRAIALPVKVRGDEVDVTEPYRA